MIPDYAARVPVVNVKGQPVNWSPMGRRSLSPGRTRRTHVRPAGRRVCQAVNRRPDQIRPRVVIQSLRFPQRFVYRLKEGIDNSGKVVGTSVTADGSQHVFVWSESGGMVDLGTGPHGFTAAWAVGINARGDILGLTAPCVHSYGQRHRCTGSDHSCRSRQNRSAPRIDPASQLPRASRP